jgi:hypothetical protein
MPLYNVVTAFSYSTHDGRHYRYERGEHDIPENIAALPFVQPYLQPPPHAWQVELANAQPKPWPVYIPPIPQAGPTAASTSPEREPPTVVVPAPSSSAALALGQAKGVMRERRALQEAVQDAQDELAEHQKSMQALMASLTDANDESFEGRAAEARQQLKELKGKLETAKAELADFNAVNVPAEELERRARDAERQLDQEQRTAVRQRFGANLIRRIALLDELRTLETEAVAIYKEADYWTYERAQGNPRAGLLEHLVAFIPADFWARDSYGQAGHRVFDQWRNGPRRHAEEWLRQWGMSLEDSGTAEAACEGLSV